MKLTPGTVAAVTGAGSGIGRALARLSPAVIGRMLPAQANE